MKTRLIGSGVFFVSLSLWLWFYRLAHELTSRDLTPASLLIGLVAVYSLSVAAAMLMLGDELSSRDDTSRH